MDLNPIHIIHYWANKTATAEAREAKRQRNATARESGRVRREAERNAKAYLEGQGFVVVEKEKYDALARQLQQTQEESGSLRRQLVSAVSRKDYEALEQRLNRTNEKVTALQQQLAGMVPRSALDQQRTRAEAERDSLTEQLRLMVTRQDYQAAQRALEEKTATVKSLQRELAEAGSQLTAAKEESRRRGTIIYNIFSAVKQLLVYLPYGPPPEGRVIAICNRDVHSIVASAQLRRIGGIGIGYAFQDTWHKWLPQLNISETKTSAIREIILVGLYPESDEAISQLNGLYEKGFRVTIVTDRQGIKAPSFASVRYATSLARALNDYATAGGVSDEVIERLASLGDACVTGSTEEAAYLRDSMFNPLDTGLIRGVTAGLSTEGTLAGLPVYEGVKRRAEDYRALHRDGFRI